MTHKKPANQGSAGKPNVQKPRTSGVPSPSKPGKSTILFGKQPGGTRGSKTK